MNENSDRLSLGLAIALLAIFIAIQSALVVPLVMFSLILHHTMAVNTTLLAVANSLAIVPTVWLGSLFCGRPWRELVGFGPMPWRLVPAIVLMVLGCYVLCSEVENVTRMVLPMPEFVAEITRNFFDVSRNPVGAALALVVVAPLTEELMCRRWVLASMLRKWTPGKAIAGSALVFGLLHMNPWQFFYATVLGLVLGWLYWRTRSLWICVLVHALNNGTSWLLTFFKPDIAGMTGDPGQPAQFQAWWLDLAAVVVFALGARLFAKQTPIPPRAAAPLEAPPVIPVP